MVVPIRVKSYCLLLFAKKFLGEISCQFLSPAGSTIPRYVLQLLFSEKNHKFAKNSTTTEAREK